MPISRRLRRDILLFSLVEHVGKANDKDGFHEFRRLKADSKETYPALCAACGHSDDKDKDNEEEARSVEPLCFFCDDPVIIVGDDKNEAYTGYKSKKLFYDQVIRSAVNGTCCADEIGDADCEKNKTAYNQIPIEVKKSPLIDSHMFLLPL